MITINTNHHYLCTTMTLCKHRVSRRQKQLQIEPSLDGRISLATVRKDGKAITSYNFKGYPKYSKKFIKSEIESGRKNIEH